MKLSKSHTMRSTFCGTYVLLGLLLMLGISHVLFNDCQCTTAIIFEAGSAMNSSGDSFKTFFELATEIGTDKVTTHSYQHAYELYLPALRHKPVKMLEIGLGCGMPYGPGKSLDLWDRYLTHPNSSIFFIEYDKVCAKEWENRRERIEIVSGDQADVTMLNDLAGNVGVVSAIFFPQNR